MNQTIKNRLLLIKKQAQSNFMINSLDEKKIIVSLYGQIPTRLLVLAMMYQYFIKNNIKMYVYWETDTNSNIPVEQLVTSSGFIILKKYPGIVSKYFDYFDCNNLQEITQAEKNIHVRTCCCIGKIDRSSLISIRPKNYDYDGNKDTLYVCYNYKSPDKTSGETHKISSYNSKISLVESLINNIISKNSATKINLMTDQKSVTKELKKMYGTRLTIQNSYHAIYDIIDCNNLIIDSNSMAIPYVNMFRDKKYTETKDIIADQVPKLNLNGDMIKKGNSIVTVCMNRNEHLVKSLMSWLLLDDLDEIIIVDWSSDITVEKTLKSYLLSDDRIKIFRVVDEERWVLTRAYNLAIQLASYSNIYKLDADNRIAINTLITDHPLVDDMCYFGTIVGMTNITDSQISGVLFCTRKRLFEINCYNENITAYGWDDNDIKKRLVGIKKGYKQLEIKYFNFIEHTTTLRLTNTKLDRRDTILLNRYLTRYILPNWDLNSKRSTYEFVGYQKLKLINRYNLHVSDINPVEIYNIMKDLDKFYLKK